MKKIIGISVLAFALGVAHISKNLINSADADIDLARLMSLNMANAETTSDNGTDQCKSEIDKLCNMETQSVTASCTVTKIIRTFTSSSGTVKGTGVVTGGVVTITSGVSTNYYTDQSSTSTFTGTRVNCPTTGSWNTCVPYDPCT